MSGQSSDDGGIEALSLHVLLLLLLFTMLLVLLISLLVPLQEVVDVDNGGRLPPLHVVIVTFPHTLVGAG